MNFKNYLVAAILLLILSSGNIAAKAETQIDIRGITDNHK